MCKHPGDGKFDSFFFSSHFYQLDLFIHMKGLHIGALNIYQQPVVGFPVKKLSLTTNQGPDWFKRQVQFDSDTEFQVCKNTSNRCVWNIKP